MIVGVVGAVLSIIEWLRPTPVGGARSYMLDGGMSFVASIRRTN